MKTENVGEAIKNAFQFLGLIFADTSKLLTVVEEYMNKENFVSFYGATSVWNRSWAYYGFYGWLPHYLCRVYVPKEGPEKGPSSKGKLLAFVNIYFVPENVPQPVVVSGAAYLKSENFDNSWTSLMLSASGPNFISSVDQESWATYQGDSESQIESVHYKVYPLVQFEDQLKVEAVCRELVGKFLEMKVRAGRP
jgi:hypothetical protein